MAKKATAPKSPEEMLIQMSNAIVELQTQNQQMVNHINTWVAKLQGIDAIAYVALLLHGDVEIKLTKESVNRNAAQIKTVLKEMERYQKKAAKDYEKEHGKSGSTKR